MAEYRIVAKLDPQTAAGANKVKQDLRGVQAEAKATEAAMNRSFDQAKFDKTIGGLVTRLDQLDGKLGAVGSAAVGAGKQFDTTAGSLDRMTAAEFRAAGGLDGLNQKASEAAGSNARLEASLRRVLQATDSQAAEQLRLNALLADAKRLFDAGRISAEQYAAAQRLAAVTGKEQVAISGSQRIGMQQLGFQLGDVATMYSLGAKPAQIFASQIGQVSQALMLMGDGKNSMLGRVAGFLGGPWGIALTIGSLLLVPFISKLMDSNSELEKAVDKKKKDARESEITRQAHERWISTLDGLIERQGKLADAMRDRLKVQGLADQSDLNQANRDKGTLEAAIQTEQNKLAGLRRQLATASAPVAMTGGRGDEARLGQQAGLVSRLRGEIKAAEGEVARLQGGVRDASTRILAGQIIVGEAQGRAMVDMGAAATQWGDRYTGALRGILARNEQLRAQTPTITAGFEAVRMAVDKAAAAGVDFRTTVGRTRELGLALEAGKISASAYRTEMAKFAAGLNAAAEAAEKAGRKVSDGVSRFTSAKQAIGVAGRELRSAGFAVGENEQFGGTKFKHTGAGHAENRAIDVDIAGASDKQKTPENIRTKYDGLARRYAARGYIVLWAGKRYDPSGAITNIPAGDHQHYGHMHLEAPQTIVGKATQAGSEAAVIRGEKAEERVVERAEDFVSGIVNQAATRGLPSNSQSQLNSAIDEALNEFKRRFDREASTGEKATITKAFTDADARETAQRFEQAYVEPLKRLQELQGKTGIDRAVLNAQLDEAALRGRALTDVEAKQIETGIRGSDQLQRKSQLLEQIRGPMQAYTDMVQTLNALLAEGSITQTAYNARLADLNNQAVQTSLQGVKGVDPATGRDYEDLAAVSDENTRYAQQLANFETYRTQLLQLGIDYDALEAAAKKQHSDNLAAIDEARRELQMNSIQAIAGSMTSILADAFGKQSRIARAAFAAEKAVTIARASLALYQNVAEAMKVGFPQNIPLIAAAFAQGATIMGAIRGVAAPGGYKDGGWTGDGHQGRGAGEVHGQEFVVKAPYARENRSLLEAINSGRQARQISTGLAREAAGATATAAPVVVPAPAVNLRMINVTDAKMVEDYFTSPAGEQTFVNLVSANSDLIRRAAGNSG
ncbi:MAG: hypothetical protein WKF79_00390 [Nocardioides sp.]